MDVKNSTNRASRLLAPKRLGRRPGNIAKTLAPFWRRFIQKKKTTLCCLSWMMVRGRLEQVTLPVKGTGSGWTAKTGADSNSGEDQTQMAKRMKIAWWSVTAYGMMHLAIWSDITFAKQKNLHDRRPFFWLNFSFEHQIISASSRQFIVESNLKNNDNQRRIQIFSIFGLISKFEQLNRCRVSIQPGVWSDGFAFNFIHVHENIHSL